MMKYILSIFIILGIVCVSSCKFPAPDNNIQEDEIDVMEGKISITIPLIHPRLVEMVAGIKEKDKSGETKNPAISRSERIYLFIDRAEFELYDSGLALIDSWTISGDVYESFRIVPPGTGYSLTVNIYNDLVSGITPVVSGSAASIDVTATETTDVYIVCTPNDPVLATESVIYPDELVPALIDFGTGDTITYGAEIYYQITPSTTDTMIEVTPDTNNFVYIFISDDNGNIMTDSSNNLPGETLQFYFSSTPGNDYFVTIVLLNETNQNPGTFDITYSPYTVPTDPYEPNNDSLSAYTLPANTLLSDDLGYGVNLYGDSDFFHIYVDGSSGLGLSIDCYLVDTMQPFWDYTRFRLYDDTLSSLATISLRTIGMDTLDYTLPAAGDYYLAVSGTSFTNIVQYDISWESEVIVPWGGPTTLDGGADSGSAEEITFLDHWYTSTIPVYEDSMWYSVTVSTSSTYEIYWDERYSGSGTYTGDMMVFVYQTDGTTLYDSADSGYNDPLEITPVETTLLIEVNAFWEGGSFAVGLTEQ